MLKGKRYQLSIQSLDHDLSIYTQRHSYLNEITYITVHISLFTYYVYALKDDKFD